MACVLQIGAGGVGGVVAHKMAMNREVFSRIILASRNISKCQAIADSIRAKGLGEIEIDSVDADKIEEVVALIEKYKPFLVVNVALPYQDLSIMEACLRTKTHYLDTANYEHPDSAHFEYKEQWVYDSAYKEAGIFALLGSGFDPGVTNVFCAYAQKHYFDEIHSIDILDCNAGDHGYAFATNFNPEINLREVSSKARYWVKNSSLGMQCDGFSEFPKARTPSSLTSENSTKTPATTTQNTRICKEELESNLNYKTHTKEDSAFSSHSESFRHSEPTGEEYKDVSLTLNMTKTCHSECNEESKRDVSLNAQHDRGVSGIRPQNDANSHSDHTTHSAPHRHSERSEESNFIKARLSLNADMPQGGKEQGIDSHNGSGVWNMEQNDPDPFMQELNKQGLPYVVIEIDSNGKSKLLEDGRK